MTDKKFAVAGVSTLNGKTKIRFANDAARIKILIKNDHKDVELIDLPTEMTKSEIAQHLIATGFGKGNSAIEAAVADLAKKNRVKADGSVNKSTITTAETAEAVTQ